MLRAAVITASSTCQPVHSSGEEVGSDFTTHIGDDSQPHPPHSAAAPPNAPSRCGRFYASLRNRPSIANCVTGNRPFGSSRDCIASGSNPLSPLRPIAIAASTR